MSKKIPFEEKDLKSYLKGTSLIFYMLRAKDF